MEEWELVAVSRGVGGVAGDPLSAQRDRLVTGAQRWLVMESATAAREDPLLGAGEYRRCARTVG